MSSVVRPHCGQFFDIAALVVAELFLIVTESLVAFFLTGEVFLLSGDRRRAGILSGDLERRLVGMMAVVDKIFRAVTVRISMSLRRIFFLFGFF